MKTHKNKLIIATYTSLILTGYVFAKEIITTKSLITTVRKINTEKKAIKESTDPAIKAITSEIFTPVRLQETRSHRFSRAKISRVNTYEIVETTSDSKQGVRHFEIIVLFSGGFHNITSKNTKFTTTKKSAKPKGKTYLKLKYLTTEQKILVQQNNEWVEREKHLFLAMLPKNFGKK